MDQTKFINMLRIECAQNAGCIVFQPIDGLFNVLHPEHSAIIDEISSYSIRTISIDEAYDLGFEEMANWSLTGDKLIYSEGGILFNLGTSVQA